MTTTHSTTTIIDALETALPGHVDTDPALLDSMTVDRSGHRSPGTPLAVVNAATIEDVQAACRLASEFQVPLVTRGAGTGLAGGAIASPGEIVLSLTGMNRILEVSPENRLAVVEPGILNGALNRALAGHGLWWAPDPASKDISTVGGNIAMNAGGLLCAKYGVTREAVLALKVVLADGRLITVGHRTVKGVTGFDVCALMIGSEGTLGIIVEATLKLLPLVEGEVATVGGFFGSVEDAAAASSAVTAHGLVPSIMELMDGHTITAMERHAGTAVFGGAGAFLLVQCDGPDARATAERVAELAVAAGGRVEVTTDPVEANRLVGLRRNAFPALEAMGTMLVEDMAVPRDRMADAFAEIRRIEDKYDVVIPTTCHAGDGNLHPSFVYTGDEVPEKVWAAAGEMFHTALDLGGTLSGEHGIGLLKRTWLRDELGDDQYELQLGIKQLFDPLGILNPGKVFVPES
ncbi:FAD-binding oxidoreductase [Arthrobacter sp. JSM 101049]|uniref:FAD-binding oxidoreductase n=1 Tax=Arthrobacter sp. JSM 101049 TaxID=929097 RepID=UPI003568DB86